MLGTSCPRMPSRYTTCSSAHTTTTRAAKRAATHPCSPRLPPPSSTRRITPAAGCTRRRRSHHGRGPPGNLRRSSSLHPPNTCPWPTTSRPQSIWRRPGFAGVRIPPTMCLIRQPATRRGGVALARPKKPHNELVTRVLQVLAVPMSRRRNRRGGLHGQPAPSFTP